MGEFGRGRAADAGADALAHGDGVTGPHRNAHLRRVAAQQLPTLPLAPEAPGRQGRAIPGVIAKDAVGLGNDMPAFDVGDRRPVTGSWSSHDDI